MFNDLEVRKSEKIGQFGVFAKRNFKKGELVLMTVPGTIIHKNDFKYVSPYSERWNYYDENHYYFMSDPEYYINHSCDPNIILKDFAITAIRPIKKGEEVCYDYSLDGIDRWKMECRCGKKRCRKIVDGRYFELSEKLQKEYLPYLPEWFKRHFRKKLELLK